MITIKVRQNGSYVVTGDEVQLVDWNGRAYPLTRRPFALCSCGQSKTRTFGAGSHREAGFVATEAAPEPDAT